LLAVAALSAGGLAGAADLVPDLQAPPPVGTTWTGCYVGAGGDYRMYDQTWRLDPFPELVRLYEDGNPGGRGWFGTVQVGCDYQFGNFLVRPFADKDAWNDACGVRVRCRTMKWMCAHGCSAWHL
jgi:outer membrane immunogenic protein